MAIRLWYSNWFITFFDLDQSVCYVHSYMDVGPSIHLVKKNKIPQSCIWNLQNAAERGGIITGICCWCVIQLPKTNSWVCSRTGRKDQQREIQAPDGRNWPREYSGKFEVCTADNHTYEIYSIFCSSLANREGVLGIVSVNFKHVKWKWLYVYCVLLTKTKATHISIGGLMAQHYALWSLIFQKLKFLSPHMIEW